MASRTHTTTGLLPATPRERLDLLGTQQARQSLLSAGPGRLPGPVTVAIRNVRGIAPDHSALRGLRQVISDRIERDLALLDAIVGDSDFEPEGFEEQHDAEDTEWRMRGGQAL